MQMKMSLKNNCKRTDQDKQEKISIKMSSMDGRKRTMNECRRTYSGLGLRYSFVVIGIRDKPIREIRRRLKTG